MKRSMGFLALCAGLVAGAAGHAKEIKSFDANAAAPAQAVRPAMAQEAARLGGAIASIDERTGTPSFLWATGASQKAPAAMAALPGAAAMHHLTRFAGAYGLSPGALGTAQVAHVHDLGRGAVVVTLRQRIGGVEVYRQDAKVIMRQDLSLVAISGSLHPDGTPQGKPGARTFTVAAPSALANALQDLYGVAATAAALQEISRDDGGYHRFDLRAQGAVAAAGIAFTEPARAKQVYFPVGGRLVPAWFVEVYAGNLAEVESDYVRYVIAADDGRVLYRENLTAYESFDYRVWSDPAGDFRPLDGPIGDHTPHPAGMPDGSDPAFVAPVLVSMEGFNTNPSGIADPWLLATAVETRGNNVDAYSDHNAPDGYTNGDMRATTTATRTFDRVYDVNLQPVSSTDQTMAATAQLFFTNNWLHDYFYDSGFNEAAANAQQSNFGRGGLAGDVLRAEAQDGAFVNRNNANMSTPADGVSPRMQMYLWNSNDTRSLTIQPTNADLPTGSAAFGPTDFNVTAPLVLVNDGTGASPTDGCEVPFVNAAEVAGKIVLIDRGSCSFKLKTANAEAAGAVGVLIANNVAGPPNTLGNDATVPAVNIPALSVALQDGTTLKQDLAGGQMLTATMFRVAGVERDGTIDNAIVAHEWGHYFHHRLTECGTKTCSAMSEGWGDFIAQHMVIREGDDLDGTFALAIYSTKVFGDSGYFGIRRSPYTTNMTANGLTFRHIQRGEPLPSQPMQPAAADNDQVHNSGEIWSLMLFEAYRNLLLQSQGPNPPYTFAEARRRMADYIVGGLKGAPVDATYTETRDAILAAAYAADPADATLLAMGFAKRGNGSCAVAPPRLSDDFVGVVESFELNPKIDITAATIDDSVLSCDSDGLLDGEERGRVRVRVANPSVEPLTGAQLTVATTTAGVSFPAGATMALPDVPPFGAVDVDLEVELDASFTQRTILDLSVTVQNADACVTEVIRAETPAIHMDDVPASSASDTVESSHVAWTTVSATTGVDGATIWGREKVAADNHVWHGIDLGSTSDTWIESPDLMVSATDPLMVTFDHYHSFEADTVFWDGGVIEIGEVTASGVTWQDISTYADPGYGGTITNTSGNPLADRLAFVGENASYPMADTLSLNLGTALAGKTVRVRFRIGTDAAVGGVGWGIDNLAFQGITNTPFGSVVDDQGVCNGAPVADAGPDQTVEGGTQVLLDASASSDPNMDPLTFMWQQAAGDQVTVFTNGAMATFTAPDVTQEVTLTFEVAVSDGVATATDTVSVMVVPASTGQGGGGGGGNGGSGGEGNAPPTSDDPNPEGGGCGCVVAGDDAGADSTRTASLGALAALGMVLARRRRRARA